MTLSVQVLYPTDEGSKFDHEYSSTNHMKVVAESFDRFVTNVVVTQSVSGSPDQPAGYHAIATTTFADRNAMDAAVAICGRCISRLSRRPSTPAARPSVSIVKATAFPCLGNCV